jgi:hypothetical protein
MTYDDIERLEAEKLIRVHEAAIENLVEQREQIQRRIDQREELLRKARLTAKGVKPCLVCNRHVESPCNSRGGMMEEGPWDQFCQEFMDNREGPTPAEQEKGATD